jgi:hypothetical protein
MGWLDTTKSIKVARPGSIPSTARRYTRRGGWHGGPAAHEAAKGQLTIYCNVVLPRRWRLLLCRMRRRGFGLADRGTRRDLAWQQSSSEGGQPRCGFRTVELAARIAQQSLHTSFPSARRRRRPRRRRWLGSKSLETSSRIW